MIRILIVDDSALVRKLLGEVFTPARGFTAEFAKTGVEALDKLNSFKPDVITLDVNMPVMDGLSCLDRIMVERPCPVVMLSSATAAGAEATFEALRLGAVDVIAKPSGTMSLAIHEMVDELVDKVKTASSARISTTHRLTERVRHRSSLGRTKRSRSGQTRALPTAGETPSRLMGEGLVLIGTSTGGPPALEAVLTKLEKGFPWPVLVVQHMPATFTGALAKRLDGLCQLAVKEVSQMTRLEPGHVYIAQGDADMIVSRRGDGLVAMPAPAIDGYLWRPSVDRMVRTAMANVEASQLVCVLMTGMGNDGADAMTAVHTAGGRTIAESEDSAVIWGMPGELAKAGGADWVVPLEDIGALVSRLVPAPCP